MAATDKHIGRGRCPLCNADGAIVGVSTKGLAYLTCGGCKSQTFARGGDSDERIRACINARPAVAEAPDTKPAAPPPPPPPKRPVVTDEPPPPPPKRGIFDAWGI